MKNEFYPGERVLLSGSIIRDEYNNRMCTIVESVDETRYRHYIDGYGDHKFTSFAICLHHVDPICDSDITLVCDSDITLDALEEVLG